MDKDIILTKIESLSRSIQRIESKNILSVKQLSEDYDLQDIVSVNLERAVQQCVDVASHMLADYDDPIPDTMAEAFHLLAENGILSEFIADRMKMAVGFRNIMVHNYQNVDWGIVYSIITKNMGDFRGFAKEIIVFLDNV